MNNNLSYTRGTLTGNGITILLTAFGLVLFTKIFTSFWIIGLFGILMLGVAFCFTGIEFNIEKKTYREFYKVLFFKFGKWQSYEDFKFVSLHGVTLSSAMSLPNVPVEIGTYSEQTAKIILLNQTHLKKLFIIYSKEPQETKKIVDELINRLELSFAKFSPPTSQTRLRRKK